MPLLIILLYKKLNFNLAMNYVKFQTNHIEKNLAVISLTVTEVKLGRFRLEIRRRFFTQRIVRFSKEVFKDRALEVFKDRALSNLI